MATTVGLGLRPELWDWLLEHPDDVDVVEVMADDLLHLSPKRARAALQPLRTAGIDLVVHGVGLSLATVDVPDHGYLKRLARLLDALEVDSYSEHCSFHRLGSACVGQFMPTPFTQRWAALVARNVGMVMTALRRPLLIENIAYTTEHPHQGLGEAGFLRAVCEQADCGLLLDLENVRVNAANHGYDAWDFLGSLPLERVGQLHIAGGHVSQDGTHVDSHSAPASTDVLAMVSAVSAFVSPGCVAIIERDKAFPKAWRPLKMELDDVRLALQSPSEALSDTRSFESGQDNGAAHVEPRELQAEWLRYFGDVGQATTAKEGTYPATVPQRHRQAFAQVLDTKRQDKLASTLAGTWRSLAIVGAQRRVLDSWYASDPRQDYSRAAEAAGFCAHIQSLQGQLPEALLALAAHENAVVALRATNHRKLASRLMPQTRRLRLRYAPDALDAVASGGPLPEPLPRTIEVCYTRHADGVRVVIV